MCALNMQNTPQGTFMTYKLNPDEKLDRMTMGMLTNNQIKGVIPVVYSQIDEERWIKYEVTSMVQLDAYLSHVLTRQKALQLLKQVADVFILAEDYMIDASFIVLDPQNVFIDPVTGELGILCLPVIGYVCKVTLRNFFFRVMELARFRPDENRDYVTQIQNYVNSRSFSVEGLRKKLEELIKDSVQRVVRSAGDGFGGDGQKEQRSMDPLRSMDPFRSMEEAGDQMAVAIEAVAQMANQNVVQSPGGQREETAPMVTGKGTAQEASKSVLQEKPEKKTKGLFGRKKREKKEKKKKPEKNTGMEIPGMSVPGMSIPGMSAQGMSIPGMPASDSAERAEPAAPAKSEVPVLRKTQDLSGIADSIMSFSDDKPEWNIAADFNEVAISDATVFLDLGQETQQAVPASQPVLFEPSAVLKRTRTGEQIVLQKHEFKLGKDANQVDYCISDNSTISRVHARIVQKDRQYFIVDENSLNHTYVNERLVVPSQEYPLTTGSRIRLSDEEFSFTVM